MWEKVSRLLTNLVIFSTLLSVLFPLVAYKLNQKIHNDGDPPWKRKEKTDDLPLQNSKPQTNENE